MRSLALVDVAFVLVRIVGTIVDAIAQQLARDAEIVRLALEVGRAGAPARVGLTGG